MADNKQIKQIKQIKVDTGVSPDFLQNVLTQDLTTLEAIIDMVDNSIDSARDELLENRSIVDSNGLPNDYTGYHIKIRIDADSVRIIDNGCGINEKSLKERAFHTGRSSSHSYGIGYYGVGLKRALLKIGDHYAIVTDDGAFRYKKTFDNNSFGGGSNNQLSINAFPSKNKRMTLFSVSNLRDSVKYDIDNKDWFKNAIKELETRYAIYLQKGLKITIYNSKFKLKKNIQSRIPKLRNDLTVSHNKKILKEGEVNIYIESGIHEKYTFTKESIYNKKQNKTITDDFGLYFICNDRVIVAGSTEQKHGWSTKWHSEYNGFVCLIRFISKNPGLLPWNTSKTALKTDSTIFLNVKNSIKPMADKYRSDIKKYLQTGQMPEAKPISQPTASDATPPAIEPAPSVVSSPVIEPTASDATPLAIKLAPSVVSSPVIEPITSAATPPVIEPAPSVVSSPVIEPTTSDATPPAIESTPSLSGKAFTKDNKIKPSDKIISLINKLDLKKLATLYKAICQLSLKDNSALAYVGVWVFFESLSSFMGKNSSTNFPSFLNTKINDWYGSDRTTKNTYKVKLNELDEQGNTVKHHGNSYPLDARQLAIDFETLEPLIVKCLEEVLREKNNRPNKSTG